MNDTGGTQPDWVLYGSRTPDGRYCVTASRDLDRATVAAEVKVSRQTGRQSDDVRYRIAVETGNIVVAEGDTYLDAVRALFTRWSPEGAVEIEPLSVELEP